MKSLGRIRESNTTAVFCLLLTMVLFGFSFLFTRVALASASAFTLLSWRFFTAFDFMTLLRAFRVVKIKFKGFSVSLLCIGLFHPILYFTLETFGIALTSVSESSIIISTVPIVSMLMAALFLKEPPTRLQTVSVILAVLGTVVVVLGGSGSYMTFSAPGYLALFGAVFSGGFFFIFSRRAENYSSAAKAYVMLGMGFITFTIAAAAEHIMKGTVSEWLTLPFRNLDFMISLLYLGALASIAGTWALNFGIARLGVHRSSAFMGISTVVSIIAGVLILHEPFTFSRGAGAAMILLGVTGVNLLGKKS